MMFISYQTRRKASGVLRPICALPEIHTTVVLLTASILQQSTQVAEQHWRQRAEHHSSTYTWLTSCHGSPEEARHQCQH
jgi:hypothetical protein